MPYTDWKNLNKLIVNKHLRWEDINERLLHITQEIDNLRKTDRIPEGIYRQKGNIFRDTVAALVESRCNIKLTERRVHGRTDKHVIDLTLTNDQSHKQVTADAIVVAGEAKMIGGPKHERGGKSYRERTIQIDIDKRAKEVKYTPIDLKRFVKPKAEAGWRNLIEETSPAFFSAWLMRLATKDRIEHITAKLEGMTEYQDAVGVAIYDESQTGQYRWVNVKSANPKILTIGELIDWICKLIRRP